MSTITDIRALWICEACALPWQDHRWRDESIVVAWLPCQACGHHSPFLPSPRGWVYRDAGRCQLTTTKGEPI